MNTAKNVPKLRFKGFTEAWERRKVSEITIFHKQGFYTTEDYDDSKKYYLLRGTDLTENRLILKETPKINATDKDYQAFKTEIGDFLIVRSGTVGTYGIVDVDIPAIFGSYLIDFRFDMKQVTNEFFGYFYQSDNFKKQLSQIVQKSANTNINAENIKSTSIILPSLAEQKKICEFLVMFDNLITLHKRKCDKLKEYKKGCLQKMFPRGDADVPEVRFPGFTGAWERRKLENVTKEFRSGSFIAAADIHEVGQYPVYGGNGLRGYADEYNHDGEYALIGRQGALCGNVNYSKGKAYFTEHAVAVEANTLSYTRFLFYLLDIMNLRQYSDQSAQPGLAVGKIIKLESMFPVNEEQKKIANFFTNLDNLIALHKRECEKYKELKKGLLQQMFV